MLADYLGGALDGTPEQGGVARLVAQDPAWAQAHALLAPALDGVRAELAEWGAPAAELPAEIADRIRTALTADLPAAANANAAGTDDHPTVGGPEVAAPSRLVTAAAGITGDADEPEAAGGKVAAVPPQPLRGSRRPGGTPRPGQERSVPSRPGRRRRWARLAGPVALAAATVVGLGALQLSRPDQGDEAATGTALNDRGASPVVPHGYLPQESATDAATGRAPAAARPSFRIVDAPQRSGTDYTPEALLGAVPPIRQFSTGTEPEAGGQSEERLPGPGDLTRLGDQRALNACLAEIGAEHGGGPLAFEVIDYARFQGLPALVVRFTDVSGGQWAWVSGPECGVPGSGSDPRYRTRVG
nr:hypothetical protein [Micromonospora tarapacensis]